MPDLTLEFVEFDYATVYLNIWIYIIVVIAILSDIASATIGWDRLSSLKHHKIQ